MQSWLVLAHWLPIGYNIQNIGSGKLDIFAWQSIYLYLLMSL